MSSEEKTEITEKPSSTEQQPPSQLHTPPITPTTISTSIPIKNKKSENVNLFAADDRRTPLSLGPSTKSSSSLPPSMPVMGNPMSSAISSTTRNNLMESQAEIYKLEAEKEQVQIDQERIADKKVSFSHNVIELPSCYLNVCSLSVENAYGVRSIDFTSVGR